MNKMPNTYSQLFIQIVFAVKGRECFINESFREELQKYITGIVEGKNQKLYAVYCMPDHVHIFVSLKPDMSISNLVRDIKANSSSFIKEKKWVISRFSWQEGFGAFSYSKSHVDRVVKYVMNQKEHHQKKTFRQEYLAFLENYAVSYDDNYLFKFYE